MFVSKQEKERDSMIREGSNMGENEKNGSEIKDEEVEGSLDVIEV